MNKDEVIKKIIPIFREVFEDQNLEVTKNSNSDNIDGWDSLNHIYLVVAIEEAFNLKFTAEEMLNWDNVGAMAEHISDNV
jgi:acyl carrier protein